MIYYFDHTQLMKRNMLLEILQNVEDLSIEVGFLLSLQPTPFFAATKTRGGSRNYKQYRR